MTHVVSVRLIASSLVAAFALASASSAAVVYSNLQGNYNAQRTTSYTVDMGSYSASGYSSNYDFGSTGLGDDYTVDASVPRTTVNGVPSVQISGFNFYGNVAPSAGDPAGSLGTGAILYFFNASGVFYQRSISFPTQFQGAAGLKTATFSPTYVPAQGYISLSPYLYSTNGGFGSTPKSYGETTLTGYFGGAPTIGTGSGAAFATTDTNRTLSTRPAQAGSQGYLQFELVGVPEPTSLAVLALGVYSASTRRRRPR